MSEIHIVREYAYPVDTVWRALTDPQLIPRCTSSGAGDRPEGRTLKVGTTFRYIAKPKPGWRSVVNCVVLEVHEPTVLRYSWQDAGGGDITEVTYTLEPYAAVPASRTATPASAALAVRGSPAARHCSSQNARRRSAASACGARQERTRCHGFRGRA